MWKRTPWWKVAPSFSIDTESTYKSIYIGWLLIVWRWDEDDRWFGYFGIEWYPD